MTLAGKGVPTLVGAAFRNQGIHNLLDAVLDYLPSPADIGEIRGRGRRATISDVTRKVSDKEPLAALAFKVQSDDAGGQLTFVRVYTGILRVGDAVLNATKGHNEQIGRLVRMFANHREDIRQIEAGMIGAVVPRRRGKLATGDTLCDPRVADPARHDRGAEPGDGRRRRARDRRGSREAASPRSSASRSRTRRSAFTRMPTPARS